MNRRIGVPVLAAALALSGIAVAHTAVTAHAGVSAEGGCEDVTGSIVSGQTGMTAVTSTSSPNLPIGSRVRISASDRDRPANSRSVVVTVTGAKQLPANICLDLSPQAFRIFDPQGAAYRDADVTVLGGGAFGSSRSGASGQNAKNDAGASTANSGSGGATKADNAATDNAATDSAAMDNAATDSAAIDSAATAGGSASNGTKDAEGGCEDVTGSIVSGQTGMTAVTSTSSPNLPIGSQVRISASDRDRPANSRSVVVTVVGAKQLPANICLDLSPEAFRIFDPQGAAYRDADVQVVARG